MDTTQNIITIPGLEGNPQTTMTPLQATIVPFVPAIVVFWWCIWIGMFLYMTTRFIVVPLFNKQ